MAYDPLSPSTRKARTGLLGFSAAVVCVELYATKIDTINIPNIGTTFDPSIIPFILGIGTIYFFVSFVISAADDLYNVEHPARIGQSEERVKYTIGKSAANELSDLRPHLLLLVADGERKHLDLSGLVDVMTTSFGTGSDFDDNAFMKAVRRNSNILKLVDKQDTMDVMDWLKKAHKKIAEQRRFNEKYITGPYRRFRFFRLYVLEVGFPVILGLISSMTVMLEFVK